jgi:hypothetical protein
MKQTTFLPTLLLLIITCALEAQTFETFCHFPDDENPQLSQKTNVFSENGQTLPANGHIEILLIYAEIDYTSGQDPNPSGNQLWGAGQLPTWKDDLLDVTFQTNPQGALSRYFHDASSGNLKVTGDYLVAPSNNGLFKFSANASDDYNELINKLLTEVNLQMGGNFITGSGITNPTYFDNWIKTGQGLPKLAGPNTPTMKFDHVMIIIRNHAGLNGTGRGSYSGFPFSTITQNLMGYDAETYTLQGSFDKIPFKICRHEFSHMILGGNTFHCAGGGVGVNYWIPYTAGTVCWV